ncbi:sugar phosphate isomerase/epimerase family protein [Neobacillus sedimentimangrovi]|uniref:sugar phosphate isomerase/epimerase family protein n=1 Tax=Neobacillus sedimentimangrovi TaxID=2699460 RepID=UPI0013D4C197|nr:sugar phosphate isomerase/epimerase [Neobacillus sedimentimangrovi]
MHHVIVPLNAFNRVEVLKRGQASFFQMIAQSGAFGVEIRRELLTEQDLPLRTMREEIEQYQLFTVFSAPVELWKKNHLFNEKEITEIFQEGKELGAKWIKVSLGHFHKEQSNVTDLHLFLNEHKEIQLLVENDQTLYGGNIHQLKTFFESAYENGVPVKMTFDVGNWHYTEQDAEEALSELAPYVHYLHLKQVEEKDGERVTVPLQKNNHWEFILKRFPSEMMKALEFPIEPPEKTKEYIQMIVERVVLCNH